jgi:hypothetical protein
MKLLPDKVGANPKQLAWLGGLLVVLVVVYFMNRTETPATTGATTAPAAPAGVTKVASIARQPQTVPDGSSGPALATRTNKVKDFHPSIKLPEGMDVTRIDPTLKLELLAKLQQVPLEGGSRSVFDWGQAPVPPPPVVAKIKPEDVKKAEEDRQKLMAAATPPAPPPPPPIPLKFYGYANRAGAPSRQAFFLDGDDIQIKGENDVIRGRYKIVRIGINSAVVEDLQNKNQQTLPLVAEQNT